MAGKQIAPDMIRVCVPKIESDVLANRNPIIFDDSHFLLNGETDLRTQIPKAISYCTSIRSDLSNFNEHNSRALDLIIVKNVCKTNLKDYVKQKQNVDLSRLLVDPLETKTLDYKKANFTPKIYENYQNSQISNHNCQYCSRNCFSEDELKQHEKTHIENKKLTCPICSKGFVRRSYLAEHMYIHQGQQPHECIYCEKRFSLNSNLVRHLRIHTGEKPYQCKICTQSFTLKKNMIEHERIHTGEKPFDCQNCDKKFSRRSSLIRHWNNRHKREKEFKCNECSKGFPTKSYLAKHVSIHLRKESNIKRKRRTKAEMEKYRLEKIITKSHLINTPDSFTANLLEQSEAYCRTNYLPINFDNIKIEEPEDTCTPCIVHVPPPSLPFVKEEYGDDICEELPLDKDTEELIPKNTIRKELYVELHRMAETPKNTDTL